MNSLKEFLIACAIAICCAFFFYFVMSAEPLPSYDLIVADASSANAKDADDVLTLAEAEELFRLAEGRKIRSFLCHDDEHRLGDEIGYFTDFQINSEGQIMGRFTFLKSFIRKRWHDYNFLREIMEENPSLASISVVYDESDEEGFPLYIYSFDWVTEGEYTDKLK